MESLPEWEEKIKHPDCEVHCFREAGSTMDVARTFAAESPPRTHLILAERQTAGRGRLGREWDATLKSFAGTYVFFSDKPAAAFQGYSLMVGCAIVSALKSFGLTTCLKWPNDILLQSGQKCGGVLIELLRLHEKTCILTGIGLNVVNASDNYDSSGALFDSSTGDAPHVCDIAYALTGQILSYFSKFEDSGFSTFRKEWLESAYGVTRPMTIAVGEEQIAGLFTGVDENGTLLLNVKGETRGFPGAQILKV